jgi:hypothetical protein
LRRPEHPIACVEPVETCRAAVAVEVGVELHGDAVDAEGVGLVLQAVGVGIVPLVLSLSKQM